MMDTLDDQLCMTLKAGARQMSPRIFLPSVCFSVCLLDVYSRGLLTIEMFETISEMAATQEDHLKIF